MAYISKRHIKAWERFNNELNAFREECSEDFAWLYEDAYTIRKVKDFKMTEAGLLTWQEYDYGAIESNAEWMYDEEDARDWLKFWKSCFRRAKRYWAMDSDTLDKIQDGEIEDDE